MLSLQTSSITKCACPSLTRVIREQPVAVVQVYCLPNRSQEAHFCCTSPAIVEARFENLSHFIGTQSAHHALRQTYLSKNAHMQRRPGVFRRVSLATEDCDFGCAFRN